MARSALMHTLQRADQRFHVRGGNERSVEGLAARVADRIDTGMRLTTVARESNGAYRLGLAVRRHAA